MTPLHSHRAFLDPQGNGTTDIVASHFHRVVANRVLPSPVDSHEHYLTQLPCGPGR